MDIKEKLHSMVDPEFRKFTCRLLPGVDGVLGDAVKAQGFGKAYCQRRLEGIS